MSEQETLAQAYAVCRQIARREAKNFYYSFLALPRHKRNAMCAVYAFMRRADDISDDESQSVEARKRVMQQWISDWHTASAGGATQDAVFLAVRDTKRRFAIPDSLFDQLIQGTSMDLERSAPVNGQFDTYPDFAALYQYCYLVASVVGLVCIHIFGYTDRHAEKLAEETGIAFQLTNILRDVREDASRQRIYIPLDDLARHGVAPEMLAAERGADNLSPGVHAALQQQASRAREYYKSAQKLLPLIDADSRPALEVLVTIYRRLLERIEARSFDVFSERISVPKPEKWMILLRGMRKAVTARVGGAR